MSIRSTYELFVPESIFEGGRNGREAFFDAVGRMKRTEADER